MTQITQLKLRSHLTSVNTGKHWQENFLTVLQLKFRKWKPSLSKVQLLLKVFGKGSGEKVNFFAIKAGDEKTYDWLACLSRENENIVNCNKFKKARILDAAPILPFHWLKTKSWRSHWRKFLTPVIRQNLAGFGGH